MSCFRLTLASLALPLALASCSPHEDVHGGHDAAVAEDAGAGVQDAGPVEDPTMGAPTLERLMRMDGGLHVMWTNPSPRCVAVVGERTSAAEPWRQVFRVEGTYDNLHQDGLQAGVLYTYRLRCEREGRVSTPSNEKSATP